jgi:hypothetical protein
MILADATTWQTGTSIVQSVACIAAVIIALVALFRKTDTQVSPQPLIIAMEKEFVPRRDFDTLAKDNSARHAELFSKIGGVERGANSSIENKVEVVRRDLVVVGNQVSALQSETKNQNQQLARMDAKLDRLAEKHK